MTDTMLTLVPALVLVFVLGFLTCRLRLLGESGRARKDGRKLRIEETRSLGGRQYLLVVEYDGRRFLIGSCVGRVEYLCPLDCAVLGMNAHCQPGNGVPDNDI